MQDKFYVYAICDPRIGFSHDILTCKPVYIGKGCGNRWQTHLKEARGELSLSPNRVNSSKIETLREIIEAGFEPSVVFLLENASSDEAYEFEKSLILKFGRTGIDPDGILTNRVIDQRSLGGGKKGMKHTTPRSLEHRARISEHKRGWKPSEKTRNIWSAQRLGKKQSKSTIAKKSVSLGGANNPNALAWDITLPSGEMISVRGLRAWCSSNGFKYHDVYHSRNGFKSVRYGKGKGGGRPSVVDTFGPRFVGFVKIFDKDTGEILVEKTNQIHFENMSEALAMSLANRSIGHIHEMVFGNGASTVSGTGAVTYFPPNATGQSAGLYNQTYRKVVDDMSPLNTDPVNNNLRVQHTQNQTYSDIVVTCTLNSSEPSGQLAFDVSTDDETAFVFDEIGIKAFAANEGTGKLLTHVIFHPVQKSQNRTIEIVYTIRIFMS